MVKNSWPFVSSLLVEMDQLIVLFWNHANIYSIHPYSFILHGAVPVPFSGIGNTSISYILMHFLFEKIVDRICQIWLSLIKHLVRFPSLAHHPIKESNVPTKHNIASWCPSSPYDPHSSNRFSLWEVPIHQTLVVWAYLISWQGDLPPGLCRQYGLSCAMLNVFQHIEAESKWPPFRRPHFQSHFL